MASRTIIEIDSSFDVGTARSLLTGNTTNPRSVANQLAQFFRGLASGNHPSTLKLGSISCSDQTAAASQTGVFDGVPSDADTIVINGVTFTFVESLEPAANEISTITDASPDPVPATVAELADRTAATINASASAGVADVLTASSDGIDTITLTSKVLGTIGNAVALVDSGVTQGFAFTGANLAGGTGTAPTLTVVKVGTN